MQLTLCAELPTVAIVYDDNGEIHDRTHNWQTGQVYANAGHYVQAVNPSGGMSVKECQELYDAEKKMGRGLFRTRNKGAIMNYQLLADAILKGISEVRRKGNVEGTSAFYVTGISIPRCEVEVKPYTGKHGEYISMWIRDRLVSAHSFVRTEK